VPRADDDTQYPVRIDRRLMSVEAGLPTPVMDCLPPLIAQRVAPVDPLGWLDLQDQRRMIALDLQPISLVLIGGDDGLEVAVVVDLELVDEEVGGRGDSIHRLQADIPCGAAVSG